MWTQSHRLALSEIPSASTSGYKSSSPWPDESLWNLFSLVGHNTCGAGMGVTNG